MVNKVPVPTRVPFAEASYQLIVPADAVAFNVTVPIPQRVAGIVVAILGVGLTVTVTAVVSLLQEFCKVPA